jgi:hypothetical protein
MAEEQVLFSLPLIRVEPIFKKWMREVLQEDGTGTKGSTSQEVPLTIHEAAMITGKSVSTLYGYVHRGLIPHMKRGQRLYFYSFGSAKNHYHFPIKSTTRFYS